MALSFFKRDSELVQQLKLALRSAAGSNRSLRNQLCTQKEEKTAIEMALHVERKRSHLLNQTLDLNTAEVRDLQTLVQRLQEENTTLRASISEGDIKNLHLQKEIDHQGERSNAVTQALEASCGQLKLTNEQSQTKIQELSGQMDQQSVLNVQLQRDTEILREQLQEMTQERQRNIKLTAQYEALIKDNKEEFVRFQEKSFETTTCLETELMTTREELVNTSQMLHLKGQELTEERQKNQALEEQVGKHYESTEEIIRERAHVLLESERVFNRMQREKENMKAAWESATKEVEKLQLNVQRKVKLISDLQGMNRSLQAKKQTLTGGPRKCKEETSEQMTHLQRELLEEKNISQELREQLQTSQIDGEKMAMKWKEDTAALRKDLMSLLERLGKSERHVAQLQAEKTHLEDVLKTDERQRSRALHGTQGIQQSRDSSRDFRNKVEENHGMESQMKRLNTNTKKFDRTSWKQQGKGRARVWE